MCVFQGFKRTYLNMRLRFFRVLVLIPVLQLVNRAFIVMDPVFISLNP